MPRVARRAPPLWVLLDVLTILVLALISVPPEERGVAYKFMGLPSGSILFETNTPPKAEQRRWRHFDFESGRWIERKDITPHGRENFMCDECAEFLPEGISKPKGLMVGLPVEIRARIHEAFFEACSKGDCAPTLYIDKDGKISTSRPE